MFKKVYPPNTKNCLVDALKNPTYSFNAIPYYSLILNHLVRTKVNTSLVALTPFPDTKPHQTTKRLSRVKFNKLS